MVGNNVPAVPAAALRVVLEHRNAHIGGMPGQGKTVFQRAALLAVLIDELTEDLAWELNAVRTAALRAGCEA